MLRYMESTGKNEEEAIQAALRTLGLDRDEISVADSWASGAVRPGSG